MNGLVSDPHLRAELDASRPPMGSVDEHGLLWNVRIAVHVVPVFDQCKPVAVRFTFGDGGVVESPVIAYGDNDVIPGVLRVLLEDGMVLDFTGGRPAWKP